MIFLWVNMYRSLLRGSANWEQLILETCSNVLLILQMQVYRIPIMEVGVTVKQKKVLYSLGIKMEACAFVEWGK